MVAALVAAGAACGSSNDTDSASSFCDHLEALEESDDFQFSSLSNPDATARLAKIFDQLASSAPEQIAPQIGQLAAAAHDLADVDADDPEGFQAVVTELEESDVLDAFAAVDSYALEECGVDLGG